MTTHPDPHDTGDAKGGRMDNDTRYVIRCVADLIYAGENREAMSMLLPLLGWNAGVDEWIASQKVHRKAQGATVVEYVGGKSDAEAQRP